MEKINFKKLLTIILALTMALSIGGCKKKPSGIENSASDSTITESGLSISESEITVNVGETKTLTVVGSNNDVVWASMDESIAKVVNGEVTGLKIGTTSIIVAFEGETAFCSVTVQDPLIGVPSLEIINKSKNVKPNHKKKLKQAVEKVKRKHRREMISNDIKKRIVERAIKRTKGE